MFTDFYYYSLAEQASAFVVWIMPVLFLIGGLGLGLSLAGFVLALLGRSSGGPVVGRAD